MAVLCPVFTLCKHNPQLLLEKPKEVLKIEKGDLGDEGLEPSNDVFGFFVLVLHLNLGVILRLSITEELNLAPTSPESILFLGRKRNRGVDAVELAVASSPLLLLLLLDRNPQFDCSRGVDGFEPELLKKPSFPEALGLGAGFCWTSPSTDESDEFLGTVVQKARRHPVPICGLV